MKQILIELDDRSARELERVAPTRKRMRAEFIRLAIRRALDLELDRKTSAAYRSLPLAGSAGDGDLVGWDLSNELATPVAGAKPGSPKPRPAKPKNRAA